MSIWNLRCRLESILELMEPYWEFVNCHMVNYITEKNWEKFICEEIRAEVPTEGQVHKCIEAVFLNSAHVNESSMEFPTIVRFISTINDHQLANYTEILTPMDCMREILQKNFQEPRINIKEFLSEKKSHEVTIMSELVNDLIQKYRSDNSGEHLFVVDAGDGKGYLSSRLALQYGHKVLGIDVSESNTKNALDRSARLQRCWDGLIKRAELINCGLTPPKRHKKRNSAIGLHKKESNNYKTTARMITSELNVMELLKDNFPEGIENGLDSPNYCLTGLHTCGNLASTCLDVFQAHTNCKILCNVGCCYHLLKEAYVEQEFYGNETMSNLQTDVGFPLSKFLRDKKVKLGRNARMLASQSTDRTFSAKELPSSSLFYRALLEVLLCQAYGSKNHSIQVGKIKNYSCFNQYIMQCSKKIPLPSEILQPDFIAKVEGSNASHKYYLDLFYLLRMLFAPVLESLILMDRLLFLKEAGHENSYLVQFFDKVISPRCFGIVALK